MDKQTSKYLIIMLISVGILFGIIFGIKAFQRFMMNKFMASNQPVITVSAMEVRFSPWQQKLSASGSLRAIKGVDVTTEIAGLISDIYFSPGTLVQAGTVLVQLNIDADVARLHALEAAAELAQINYNRDKAQYAVNAVSKAVVDTDAANLKSAKAQVDAQAALIAKKTIRAPFTGRLGVSQVNPGQYLNPGDKVVTLQALDPIWVDFYIPQQEWVKLKDGQAVTITSDSYPGRSFSGKITTIDPKIDPSTRNVQVEGTIANPALELIPGMFVSVEIEVAAPKRFLTLPQTAISYNPYGEIVYILTPAGKDKKNKNIFIANQAFVEAGETRGNQVMLLKGVKEGDLVVTSGQLKLKNGSRVSINNKIVPSNNPTPNVKDE